MKILLNIIMNKILETKRTDTKNDNSISKFSGCSLTDLIKKHISEECLKGKQHPIRNTG